MSGGGGVLGGKVDFFLLGLGLYLGYGAFGPRWGGGAFGPSGGGGGTDPALHGYGSG